MNDCIKTGGWVFFTEYNNYMRGDLYVCGNVLLFRAVPNSRQRFAPEDERVWATMTTIGLDYRDRSVHTYVSDNFIVHWKIAMNSKMMPETVRADE